MKTKSSFQKTLKEDKITREEGYNNRDGIKKRLLEKYNPSKGLAAMRGSKGEIRENKAA
tara:strand:- start:135 stop:311 length:177 start_codon:yes stop_codon:yes gene_type:complete